MKRVLAAIVLLFACGAAFSHTSGSSFLALRAEDTSTVHAEWDFDVRELQQSLQLDADGNGALTWGEIIAGRSAIEALVLARTHLGATGGACTVAATDVPMIAEHGDGPYLRFIATFSCAPGALMLDHSGWFAVDAGHRALLEYEALGGARTQAILASGVGPWHATESRVAHLVRFLVEGIRHLVTGYDHLAFLGVLLLALARRRSGESASLPLMLKRAFAVITAFTLAHSLTLGLAATGHIRLPSQPVEVAIALSVMIAALLNLSRGAADHGWKLAFAFGLVHGLGFAGALAELASGSIDLFALAAFNVGIETAQVVIAAAAVPLIWWSFRGLRSERLGLPLASVCVACVAAVWVGARLLA
jgi:HupE/UreJ protein